MKLNQQVPVQGGDARDQVTDVSDRRAHVHDGFLHSARTLDCLSGPACMVDAWGRVIWLNASWKRLAGLEPGPRPALDLTSLLGPEGCRPFFEALSGAGSPHFECRIGARIDQERWYLFQVHRQRIDPDEREGFLCIGIDVHERKIREGRLEQFSTLQGKMLEGSVDCIKAIALDGTLLHVNRAGCVALGLAEDARFGMPWLPLLPDEVRAAGEAALAQARAGRPGRFPGKSILPGEAPQYWDNLLNPVAGPDGRPEYILCISREVTSETHAREALSKSRERLEMTIRLGGFGVWDYDIAHDRMTCDATWRQIMGLHADQQVETLAQFRALIHPDDRERATEVPNSAAELLASGKDYSIVFRIVRADQGIRWIRSAARLEFSDATPVRAIGFISDITEAWNREVELRERNRALKEERDILARQSLEDPLTGIGNRRFFEHAFYQSLKESREAGQRSWIAMLDADYFKAFNDFYGHMEGDEVLRSIAMALQATIGHRGLVARVGGEEFAFLLTDCEDAEPVLRQVIAAIESLRIEHEASPRGIVTVSCGCLLVDPDHARDYAECVRAADQALYAAKQSGRGTYVICRA